MPTDPYLNGASDIDRTTNLDATLKSLRAGLCLVEMANRLAEVVACVRLAQKPGELTLKLKVSPASKGDVTVVMIEDTVTSKPPLLARPSTIFFATDTHLLERSDPRQRELAFVRSPGSARVHAEEYQPADAVA
jgi:hypothetical protein